MKIRPVFSIRDKRYDESKLDSGFITSGEEGGSEKALPTLEDAVRRGISKQEIEASHRISIKKVPEIVKSTALYLKHRHEYLYSLSQVMRHASRLGATVLQRAVPSKEIRTHWKRAYLNGDEMKRIKLCSTVTYDFKFRMGLPLPQPMTCYVLQWTAGVIDDLGQDLGISASTIAILMLVAGFGRSETWVPREYRNKLLQEIGFFQSWISEKFGNL